MDLLIEQEATQENLDRAQSLFEKVIAEAYPGSDELIAALYGMSVVHEIRGDSRKMFEYLLASGMIHHVPSDSKEAMDHELPVDIS
jgi:hypothetical protein